MIEINIPSREYYDERFNEFVHIPEQRIRLEHSLLSISKWESYWKKPFLTKEKKTRDELLDYVRCMSLDPVKDPRVFKILSSSNLEKISEYIDDRKTATTFRKDGKGHSREILTSEVIYYQMISYGIPFECQKWHLSRLLTLISVCAIKESPSKNMSKKDMFAQNASLNAARRAKMHSRG